MQAARTLILRDVKELKVPEDVQLDEVADTAGLCWRVRITLRDDDNTTVESDLLLRFSRRHPHEPPRIFVPWRNSTPRPKFELEWAKSAQFHELQEVFVRAFAQDSWVPITSVGNVIDELLRTVREVPVTSQTGENQLPSPSLHPDAPPTERLAASTPAMGTHANFNNDAAHTGQVHMRALEPPNRANGRGTPTESSMMLRSYGRRNRRDRRSDRLGPSLLTEEILSYVLVYLPVRDIGRLATTSQAFADICDSEVLWARLYFLQPPISDTLSAWGGGLGPSRVWVGPGKWEWDGARAAYKRAVELARALPAASLLTASYDSLEEDTAQVLNAIVKLRILCSPPSDVPSLLDFDMRNAGTVMSGVTDAVLTRRIREGAEYLRVTSQSLRTDPNPHNATRLENLVQMANRLETRRVSTVSQVAARLANEVSPVKSLTIPEMNELSAQLALSQLQQDDVNRQREIDSKQNVDQAVAAVAKARIAYRRTRDISQEQRNLQRAMRMNGMRSHNRRRMFNLQASHGNRAQIPEAPPLASRFNPHTTAFPPRADRENNINFAELRTNDVDEGNNIAAALFPGFAARTHLARDAALGQGAEAQGDPPLQWMLAPPRHGLAGDAAAPHLLEHADPRNEETEQDHPPSLLAVRDLLARNMSRIYRVGDTHVAFVLSMALKKLTLQARLLKRYLSGSTTPVEELVLGSLVRMKIGASFMSNLSHGSRVDIKDSRGDWYAGRLARRSRDHPTGEFPASASSQWVVCFDGYSAKWDEVVPNHMSALERLAPLRTHTLTDQAPAGFTTTSRPEVLTRSVLLRKTKRQRRAIVEGLQNAAFVLSPTARGSGAQAGGIAPTSLNSSQLSAAVQRSRRRPDIAYADNQAFTIKLCALGRPLIYFCTDRSQPLSEIVEEYLRVTASFNATSARSSVARGALVVRLNNRESFDTNLALRYFQAGIFGDPEDLDTPGFSEDARSRGQAQLQRYMDVEHNLLTHVEQVFALYEHVLFSNSAHHIEAQMTMADDHLGLLHEADDRVLHSFAQAARPSSATDASSRTSAAGTTAEGEDASPSLSFADAAREIETLFGDDVQILDTTRSAFELGLDSDTLLDVVPFF
ncbi:Hypothetical Protein FCC1311_037062 [Hondaea fermentalgiana]|uniref:F-box domain-containing protein n=1 Tax=Hondaea fermentalgiana TaxID=2315210 RepID=A0A2R5GHY3_9STRA|nr:Hypothetical Protein FCC1311_037062 [Hondaea fermentalgiana]|eukprot:GBG27484.1 Hypothetical Protein FCC1311_037062 [Hondaea fermentalgiana]